MAYPANLTFTHQEKSSRLWAVLTILGIKSIALIPHFIILMVLQLVSGILGLIGVFAVLFMGRYPVGMENFIVKAGRWQWRLNAYMFCLTDKYPPFDMEGAGYPATMSFAHQEKSSRLWALLTLIPVKYIILIPHMIVAMVLTLISFILMFIGVFAVLFVGRYPVGMENFIVMTYKYVWRIQAYFLCLTDQYPPISPKAE